jgi:hypothetical protein
MIANIGFGKNFVKIDDEWFARPVIPLGIKPEGIFVPQVIENPVTFKAYIMAMAEAGKFDTDNLILSVFESAVKEMDKRYCAFKENRSSL